MREELVSFETAKLAKEKGCDLKSSWYYDLDNLNVKPQFGVGTEYAYHQFEKERAIYSYSQSLLQKWLREIHNIDVWSAPFVYNQSLPDESYSYFVYKDGEFKVDGTDFLDFEKALEAGLQEALKLVR